MPAGQDKGALRQIEKLLIEPPNTAWTATLLLLQDILVEKYFLVSQRCFLGNDSCTCLMQPLVSLGGIIMKEVETTEDERLLHVALDMQCAHDMACTPKFQEAAEFFYGGQADVSFLEMREGLDNLLCNLVRLA